MPSIGEERVESREIWFFVCFFSVEKRDGLLVLFNLKRHHGDDEEECDP